MQPVRAAALLLLGLPVSAFAAPLRVTTHEDQSVDGDGLCSLREAVATVAGDGDSACGVVSGQPTVLLSGGTYCLDEALEIEVDLTLRGASDGTTVVDGGNGTGSTCAASADRLLFVTEPVMVQIQGLTLQGGASTNGGGAVFGVDAVELAFTDVVLRDNRVDSRGGALGGGAVYVGAGASLSLSGSRVEANTVSCPAGEVGACGRGGGLAADDGSSVDLYDSELVDNLVWAVDDVARGGAIYLDASEAAPGRLNLVRTRVAGNEAVGDGGGGALGGGIATERCGELVLDRALVEDNLAQAARVRAFGGGIGASFCEAVTVSGSTLRGNHTQVGGAGVGAYGGGLFLSEVGDAYVVGSTVSGNLSEQVGAATSGSDAYGGGVYLHGERVDLVNVTVSGNRSEGSYNGYGGGVFVKGSVRANLVHTTVADNATAGGAGAYGGGLSHFPPGSEERQEKLVLLNSIVTDNRTEDAQTRRGADCYDRTYTLGHNLLGDGTNCVLDTSLATGAVEDRVGAEAALATLVAEGGAVATHALGSTSEARAWGTCLDTDGIAVATDARGRRRDRRCDAGAWEFTDRTVSRTPGGTGPRTATGLALDGVAAIGEAATPSPSPAGAADRGLEPSAGVGCSTGGWRGSFGLLSMLTFFAAMSRSRR